MLHTYARTDPLTCNQSVAIPLQTCVGVVHKLCTLLFGKKEQKKNCTDALTFHVEQNKTVFKTNIKANYMYHVFRKSLLKDVELKKKKI